MAQSRLLRKATPQPRTPAAFVQLHSRRPVLIAEKLGAVRAMRAAEDLSERVSEKLMKRGALVISVAVGK